MACECRPSPSSPGNACGDSSDCINRLLLVECGPECPCGSRCLNRRFARKQYAAVSVIETPGKGHGLFATAALTPGQFIMEYVGEVLSQAAFLKRSRRYAAEGASHFYFMTLTQDLVIDASTRGNVSRFMNHSCSPNCNVQKWIVGSSMRMGLFASKAIPAGAELTFDYKFESFGATPQVCRCGEPNCKGFIGSTRKSNAARVLDPQPDHADYLSESEDVSDDYDDHDTDDDPDNETTPRPSLASSIARRRQRTAKSGRLKGGIVDVDDMQRIVQKLLQADHVDVLLRYLRILNATQRHQCLARFISLHGLKILHVLLTRFSTSSHSNEPSASLVLLETLKFCRRLPIATRNSVVASRLEALVASLVHRSDSTLTGLATALLAHWADLPTVFTIPKADPSSQVAEGVPSCNLSSSSGSTSSSASASTSVAVLQSLAGAASVKRLFVGMGEREPVSPSPVPDVVLPMHRNSATASIIDQGGNGASSEALPTLASDGLIIAPNGQPLPPNWRFDYSPQGAVFFYNVLSHVTQWHFPVLHHDDHDHDDDDAPPSGLQTGPAGPYKPADAELQEAIRQAKARGLAVIAEQEYEQQQASLHKEQVSRMKASISNEVIKFMSQFKAQMDHEIFKKFARKFTHTVLEKELKSRLAHARQPDVLDEKGIKKTRFYLKEQLDHLGYRKTDKELAKKSLKKSHAPPPSSSYPSLDNTPVGHNRIYNSNNHNHNDFNNGHLCPDKTS